MNQINKFGLVERLGTAFVLHKLFIAVVEKAWVNEESFSKVIFHKKPSRTTSLCQGISRQIVSILGDVFDDVRVISIKVKRKTHLVVFVQHGEAKFILDGTIRQFKPKEKRTVWFFPEYPFSKELKKAETWTILGVKQ